MPRLVLAVLLAASAVPALAQPAPPTGADLRQTLEDPFAGAPLDDPTATGDPHAVESPDGVRPPARPVRPPTPGPRPQPAGPAATPVRPVAQPVAPVSAVQPVPRSTLEDPYAEADAPDAPIGIRLGSFLWLPAIEGRIVSTTNLQESAGGKPGLRFEVAPELVGRSDWSRHSVEVDIRGAFTHVPSDATLDKPTGTATLRGRIDVTSETRVALETAYSVDRESLTSAETPAGAKTGSTVEQLRGSVAVTQDIDRLSLTLRGTAVRGTYTEGILQDDTTAPPDNRDGIDYSLSLRATYEISPSLRPFVEGRLEKITYDDSLIGGVHRDADGWGLKGGLAFDLGPILRGEVAVGWGELQVKDKSLSVLVGPTIDASLVYAPTRLTTLTFTAATTFAPTTLAGSPGSLVYSTKAAIAHALRRDLKAELTGQWSRRSFAGVDRTEDTVGIEGIVTWSLTPTTSIVVRGGWDRFIPCPCETGTGYDAFFAGLGLRLQR